MKNWNLVEIGNSGLKIADGNYSAKYPNSSEFISEGVPFIRANNFKNKTIIDDELYFISSKKHSELKKGHLLPNDVLITTRGNIGQVALTPERHKNSNINAQIVLLRCNESWIPKYLLYVLTIDFVTEQFSKLTTGTALKQLPVKNLKKIKLPLPPLPQQQKIANILDAADALRQNDKALIAKYDELTQALFLDMFGDPVSNPKGWEIKNIEQIAKSGKGSIKRGPFGGALKKEIFVEDGYLVYEQFHALNNDFSRSRYFIDENKFNELKGFEVHPNDIIISCSGVYLGKLAIVPKGARKGIINQALLKITLDESKMKNDFFVFLFSHKNFREKHFDANRGAGIPNFPPMSEFKKFPFISPPMKLQEQFVERVAVIEEQKAIAHKSLEKSESLFNSLLQKAFKGEL
jgi:type I restriction enzyme S subunit